MKKLINQLPEGSKGCSIESPRTIVLKKYEGLRRKFNRINKSNLNLFQFLHYYFYQRSRLTITNNDVLARLTMEIVNFSKADNYLNKSNYNNNKKY
jgi:hypothetical protein